MFLSVLQTLFRMFKFILFVSKSLKNLEKGLTIFLLLFEIGYIRHVHDLTPPFLVPYLKK